MERQHVPDVRAAPARCLPVWRPRRAQRHADRVRAARLRQEQRPRREEGPREDAGGDGAVPALPLARLVVHVAPRRDAVVHGGLRRGCDWRAG
eukprot:6377401-Prymnesium_polylepis.1